MSFSLTPICELLNQLTKNHARPTNLSRIQSLNEKMVVAWFQKYDKIIPRRGPEAVAFLSCLFPECRPDCVFGLQIRQLEKIIQRAQCLGTTRMTELRSWRTDNGVDFASCVKRVIAATDPGPRPGLTVTLKELDELLDRIAATSQSSSIDLRRRVREKYPEPIRMDEALAVIFARLSSSEMEWMVRILLRDYSHSRVPETLAIRQFHFLLPDILAFQNSLEAAVKILDIEIIRCMPFRVASDEELVLREFANSELNPQVGVMIARPGHQKARDIKHGCRLAGPGRVSVERKYDGEYCQIHVDLDHATRPIKIYSKSGKDSTIDRIKLHRAVRESLQLGTSDCQIKRQCILEGELLVWNDEHQQIEPFYKIRRIVRRSGRLIGTGQDSPVDLNENLMIVFYDILLWDDVVCLREPHDNRRRRLESLIRRVPGRADIASREIIDCSSSEALRLLSKAFAQAISRRWEGLILKRSDQPYFSFNRTKPFIKLKKDYITGLGDTADFVIIGGRRDVRDEQELALGKLWWTSICVGCLENKEQVRRFDDKPRFRIIDVVGRHGMSKKNMVYLNRHGYLERVPFARSIPEFDVTFEHGRRLQPVELFRRPFSVELMGAGFDKPANSRYFALRFPRVLKIHDDRTFQDAVSFEELQEMARQCIGMPEDSEGEEMHWLERMRSFGDLTEESEVSSNDSDSGSVTVASASGAYDMAGRSSVEEQGKADGAMGISGSSKRKMASIFPQDDAGGKRAKLGR
jgi:DNA ligase 4